MISNHNSEFKIINVALPVPLMKLFDYTFPTDEKHTVLPGMRVEVPFGRRKLTGIVLGISDTTSIAREKIKPIGRVIDKTPTLSDRQMHLIRWASRYYGYPIGECIFAAIPPALRKGKDIAKTTITYWQSSQRGTQEQPVIRGARQKELNTLIEQSSRGLSETFVKSLGFTRIQLDALAEKGHIFATEVPLGRKIEENAKKSYQLDLNEPQKSAVDKILKQKDQFGAFLLEGVTGSGKTEVYLTLIEKIIRHSDQQALVLIPEINLSPQTLQRFQSRFPDTTIMSHHSALNDSEKLIAWESAKTGQAKIIIGTRSAVFFPFKNLKCIIIDEEHDASYKQQEGFRYSARDLSVLRAQLEDCPVILGSATPSLESLNNAACGKYTKLELKSRAGGATKPEVRLIDIKSRPLQGGLSVPAINDIHRHINDGNQVMIFLNRRGFSPSYTCYQCGWIGECPNCDLRLTYHKNKQKLICHHCDFQQASPYSCPKCHSKELNPLGAGTERTEETLKDIFTDTPIIRVDRDSTRQKNAMSSIYENVSTGTPCILIGTQMLAKGHHFPNITLVIVVSADDGLFSAEYRAEETFGQLLIQVAGRSGRDSKPGEVIIQTRQHSHPLLVDIISLNYSQLAERLLQERQAHLLPPFSFLAVVRCEAEKEEEAIATLNQLRDQLSPYQQASSSGRAYQVSPIHPCNILRKGNRFRYQILIQSSERKARQSAIDQTVNFIGSQKRNSSKKVTLDVDPVEIV